MELRDLGWDDSDQWGRARYYWVPSNQSMGTWYHLECERKGLKSDLKVRSGKGAEVTVQPDMEPGRWYWSVRVGMTAKTKEQTQWGTATSHEEAMQAARVALMKWGEPPEDDSEELAWT